MLTLLLELAVSITVILFCVTCIVSFAKNASNSISKIGEKIRK